MNSVFKKLNYKEGMHAFVLNAPDSFLSIVEEFDDVDFSFGLRSSIDIDFVVLFAEMKDVLKREFVTLTDRLSEDAILWICYPKKSSKNYKSDINRDSGWEVVGESGYEGVRQVAIDEDWSALRFRKVKFIKNFTRNEKMVLSKEGKERKAKK